MRVRVHIRGPTIRTVVFGVSECKRYHAPASAVGVHRNSSRTTFWMVGGVDAIGGSGGGGGGAGRGLGGGRAGSASASWGPIPVTPSTSSFMGCSY